MARGLVRSLFLSFSLSSLLPLSLTHSPHHISLVLEPATTAPPPAVLTPTAVTDAPPPARSAVQAAPDAPVVACECVLLAGERSPGLSVRNAPLVFASVLIVRGRLTLYPRPVWF